MLFIHCVGENEAVKEGPSLDDTLGEGKEDSKKTENIQNGDIEPVVANDNVKCEKIEDIKDEIKDEGDTKEIDEVKDTKEIVEIKEEEKNDCDKKVKAEENESGDNDNESMSENDDVNDKDEGRSVRRMETRNKGIKPEKKETKVEEVDKKPESESLAAMKDKIMSPKPAVEPVNVESETGWHVVCCTLDDWINLAEWYKESPVRCERALSKVITDDFLPVLPEIIEARVSYFSCCCFCFS